MRILNSIIHEIGHFLKTSADDYCDLVSTMHDDTLVFNDGSMATILRFNGFYSAVSTETLAEMFTFISKDLSEIFIKKGYAMVFKFYRGEADNDSLERIINNKKATAKRLELQLDEILDEQYEQFADRVFKESIFITLITTPEALDKLDREMGTAKTQYAQKPVNAMDIFAGKENMYGKHSAYVEKVLNTLQYEQFFADVDKLDVVEALRVIKEQVDIDKQHDDWLPDIVNEEFNNVLLPTTSNPKDISHFLPRTLGSQLLNDGFLVPEYAGLPKSTQVIGENLVISTNMNTAPKNPLMFNELFVMLNKVLATDEMGDQSNIPYSISFILQSQSKMGIKEFIGSFLSNIGEENAAIYNSINELKKLSSEIPIVSFQFTASTWAKNTAQGASSLKERFLRMSSALESWGGLSLAHTSADDIKVWRNNIPALSNKFVGNKAILPLDLALMLMPIHRPLSPFIKNGSVIYRSVDGKLTPFELFSSFSHDHQICVTGTMGSGKSVMLSNLIFEYVLNPKNLDMPKILMIDVGFSAEGMFDLFKNALPPHKRHLVAKKVLENTKENAINPFDFKRGLKYPLPSEQELTKAFLNSLLTPKSRPQGIEGMDTAINEIYELTIDRYMGDYSSSTPKRYSIGKNEELDKLIIELRPFNFDVVERILPTGDKEQMIVGSTLPENLLYKGLSDLFHDLAQDSDDLTKEKYIRASSLAWRLAMPNLQDFLSVAQDERFVNSFKQLTDTGDPLYERIRQLIRDGISNYPCFSENTVFDVDTADLLLLDLQQVIDTNNPHKTGLFYQLCFFLFARYFKFEDSHIDTYVPDNYRDFYEKWNKKIQSTSKILIMDEFKNVQSSPSAMIGVEKSALEFRKHGMTITYAGQLARQFVINDPRNAGAKINLLNLMSYHIELSPPKGGDLDLLAEAYSMDETVKSETSRIKRDNEIGSVFYMAMKSAKSTILHQFMNNKIGNKMLWICSTTPADRTMRKVMLSKASNQMEAVSALAFYFGSSCRDMISSEISKINREKVSEAKKKEMTDELYDRTALKALEFYREYQAKKRLAEYEALQKRLERSKIKGDDEQESEQENDVSNADIGSN